MWIISIKGAEDETLTLLKTPMIDGKTGALLLTCIEIGALIAGAAARRTHWRDFGRHLGRDRSPNQGFGRCNLSGIANSGVIPTGWASFGSAAPALARTWTEPCISGGFRPRPLRRERIGL